MNHTNLNNIWLFKSDMELIVEDSIIVDNNKTKPTKQIVIKGILSDKKIITMIVQRMFHFFFKMSIIHI